VKFNGNAESRVDGLVLEITDTELANADAYEAPYSYRRINVTLASGREVWVYVYVSEQDAYHEVSAYTLSHSDSSFIHQHVVDAFAAQQADEHAKSIGITFALVGLYLHVEKAFSGRQVQRAHMQLGRQKRVWPAIVLPVNRGAMTVFNVMDAAEGADRDNAIHAWCASVWAAFKENQPVVEDLLRSEGII
jgi:hypothetical protein